MDPMLEELQAKRERIHTSLQSAIVTRNQMEGKMQSRYDTQREEWALQCSLLEHQLEEMDRLIERVSQIPIGEPGESVVSSGVYVTLRIADDEPETFLFLTGSGGHDLGDAVTLSEQSPIGKAIAGRRKGESVSAIIGQPPSSRTLQVEIVDVGLNANHQAQAIPVAD